MEKISEVTRGEEKDAALKDSQKKKSTARRMELENVNLLHKLVASLKQGTKKIRRMRL